MRRTDWEPKTDRPLSVENPTSQKKSIKLLNRKKWESSPLPDHSALSKRPVLFQRAKESVREKTNDKNGNEQKSNLADDEFREFFQLRTILNKKTKPFLKVNGSNL